MSDQPANRPRVLLADDNAGIGAVVSRLLSASCEFVGRVPDAAALFQAATAVRPDVVLLDFSLPGAEPFEVCKRLRTVAPGIRVVVFTAENDPEIQRTALESGASAFVWKLRAGQDLVSTIHAVTAARESRPQQPIEEPTPDQHGQ